MRYRGDDALLAATIDVVVASEEKVLPVALELARPLAGQPAQSPLTGN